MEVFLAGVKHFEGVAVSQMLEFGFFLCIPTVGLEINETFLEIRGRGAHIDPFNPAQAGFDECCFDGSPVQPGGQGTKQNNTVFVFSVYIHTFICTFLFIVTFS